MTISQFIDNNRDVLLDQWERAARAEVTAARATDALALRDHFPVVIADVLRAVALVGETGAGRAAGDRAFSRDSSIQHGRHRAGIVGYTVDQVMHEFVILRYVIADAVEREGLWDHQSMEAVARVLELGALRSVAEFVKSIDEVQHRMAGMLAHDIRTPLTTAKSGLSLLKEPDLPAEASKEICEMAMSGVDRALDMLEGLLDSIVAQAGDGILFSFEESDFSAEIRQACQEAKRSYSSHVVSMCPEEPIPGVFDPAAIRRIFENLVSNAIRHGARSEPVQVNLVDEGDTVLLSVNNRGEPISSERRDEIFAFLSSSGGHRRQRNWGMGLAFVKLAAEGHRGRVTLESDEADGTTFHVRLPKFARKPGKERIRLITES